MGIKALIIIVVIALLAGCQGQAQETVQNGDFKIEFLFEHDGCNVYRFNDGGRSVYFSDCRGKIEHSTTTNTGKTRTTHYHETLNN